MTCVRDAMQQQSAVVGAAWYAAALATGGGLTVGLHRFTRLPRSVKVGAGAAFAAGCIAGVYRCRSFAMARFAPVFSEMEAAGDSTEHLRKALAASDPKLLVDLHLEYSSQFKDLGLIKRAVANQINSVTNLRPSEYQSPSVAHLLHFDLLCLHFMREEDCGYEEATKPTLEALLSKVWEQESITVTSKDLLVMQYEFVPPLGATIDGRLFKNADDVFGYSLFWREVRLKGVLQAIIDANLLEPAS